MAEEVKKTSRLKPEPTRAALQALKARRFTYFQFTFR